MLTQTTSRRQVRDGFSPRRSIKQPREVQDAQEGSGKHDVSAGESHTGTEPGSRHAYRNPTLIIDMMTAARPGLQPTWWLPRRGGKKKRKRRKK